MNNKNSRHVRRKLLKSIAAGGGAVAAGQSLPREWRKPIVNSVMLPAHADTTTPLVCCEGVFCVLEFNSQDIFGHAEVNSNCTINMQGDSEGGPWSGSGSVAEDGSFSLVANFPENTGNEQAQVTGSVTPDCSRIIGELDFEGGGDPILFSGAVDAGLTSIDQCLEPSDMRLKTNIESLERSREGYSLYQFQYTGDADNKTYVGVMAQDILTSRPDAVVQDDAGFYQVRYNLLGLKMVSLDEWEALGPDSVEARH